MADIFLALCAYLIGAIPFAYIFGRLLKRIDITQAGSGNVGSVNAFKQSGFFSGILTLCADTAKGYIAVYLAASYGSLPFLPLLAAILLILGHNYNIFLGLKGGKGLAALLGVLLYLSPVTILYVLAVMVILALLSRDTNTAAGLGILTLPFFLWLHQGRLVFIFAGVAIALLVVSRHIRDFRAYLQGRRKLV